MTSNVATQFVISWRSWRSWRSYNVILFPGAASPQAVKKLLALSEQSKPRQKNPVVSLERGDSGAGGPRVDRADQPTPVNLTSESSSVTSRPREAKAQAVNGKTKVRKVQNSIGSVTSTDSGYGQGGQGGGLERLERNQSESPLLPPRRRYHQHYHRQHQHGESHHIPSQHSYGTRLPVKTHPEPSHVRNDSSSIFLPKIKMNTI